MIEPQAACGLTNKPKDPVENIDAGDVDNELAVVEYVDDMYNFYKHAEVLFHNSLSLSLLLSLVSDVRLCWCRIRVNCMTTWPRSQT